MQGILINPTLDFDAVSTVEVEEANKLASMRGYLECSLLDCVQLDDELDMWIDEQGLNTDEPQVNRVATALAVAMGVATQPCYYGKALLLARKGTDTVGLIDRVRDELLTDLSNIREAIGG